jgi:hypothetical protein
MGLRMHHARVHGKLRGHEVRLRNRREYQRKLRDRYYAQGRDSKGNLRSPGWKPRPRGAGIIKPRKPSYSTTLTGKEREDFLKRQRTYQRNHYAKQKAEKKFALLRAQAEKDAATAISSNSTNATDITGEAAKAILIAAKVIRAVGTGLKLP